MRVKPDLGTRIEIAQHDRPARLNRLVNRNRALVRLLRPHLTRNSLVQVSSVRSLLICLDVIKIKLGLGKEIYGSGPRTHVSCLMHGTAYRFYFLISLFPYSYREESQCRWWKDSYHIVITLFAL